MNKKAFAKKIKYNWLVVVDSGGTEHVINTSAPKRMIKQKYTKQEQKNNEFLILGKKQYFDSFIDGYDFTSDDVEQLIDSIDTYYY